MKGARPHLDVIGLQDHAALIRPEILQSEDEGLEAVAVGGARSHVRTSPG